MGDGFNRLMEKWEQFEQEHTKVRNDDIFRWFDEQGLWLLQEYCKECAKLEYTVSASGIDVKITTKELLLLTDLDTDILNLLRLSATCGIKVVDGQLRFVYGLGAGSGWKKIVAFPLLQR